MPVGTAVRKCTRKYKRLNRFFAFGNYRVIALSLQWEPSFTRYKKGKKPWERGCAGCTQKGEYIHET